MDQKGEGQREGLETIQRPIEEAAKKVAHTTKSYRLKEYKKNTDRYYCERRGSGEKFQTNREQGAHESGLESQGRACCELQLDAGQKHTEKKASDRTVRERQRHGRHRCMGKRTAETLCGGFCRSRGDNRRTGNIIMK